MYCSFNREWDTYIKQLGKFKSSWANFKEDNLSKRENEAVNIAIF